MDQQVIKFSADLHSLSKTMYGYKEQLAIPEQQVVEDQTRLAAQEIIHQSPPIKKLKTALRIERAGRKLLFHTLPTPNMVGVGKKSRSGGLLWLYASKRFLVGVAAREFYDQGMSMGAKAVAAVIREKGTSKLASRKWISMGHRGKQKVMLINRPIVQDQKLEQGIKIVQSSIGGLKGSWVAAAKQAGVMLKDVRAWVKKHENRKDIARGSRNFNANDKSITLTSRARGVDSVRSRSAIEKAMHKRALKSAADLKRRIAAK